MRPLAFAFFVLALAAPAFAADVPPAKDTAPEKFLPPSTQLYVRWDGVTAHNDAYKKSIWGGIMAGPTGEGVRTLVARVPKLLADNRRAGLLLDEQPLTALKANLADLKAVEKVVELLADKGVILAVEVREPALTIKNLGQAFGGLIEGKLPNAGTLSPDVQLIVIVPDVGDKAEVLFGTLRMVFGNNKNTAALVGAQTIEPFEAEGRKGFCLVPERSEIKRKSYKPLPGQKEPVPAPDSADPDQVSTAWWMEGKHFVLYTGTRTPKAVIAEMTASAAKGGLTRHPLFQRCQKTGNFESVARGFIDTERVINLVKTLAGPSVPGLKERLDSTGISGVKAVVFSSGFDGKESRALYEFDAPGERKGVLKALKGGTPLTLKDLPPMPPDVSRFSALRLDPAATYDAGLGLVEFLTTNADSDADENAGKKNHIARIKERKDEMARAVDQALGISMADDLLPHLGDKLVVFQSPGEGFYLFGTVVCISVKDAAKVKTAFGRIQSGIEAVTHSSIKVRKRVLKGVEYREFYARGFGIVTPTYAIVDDWLVIASHPQAVQGVILRAKGDLEKWKPDDATAKRLAKMPAGCGLQYCDPRPTVTTLCVLGAPFLSALNLLDGDESEEEFDPIETSIIPNAYELNKHLFPNLTVTRDDGKTIRVEVNESFSLPFEMFGVESFGFLAALGLSLGF
jgi:hypothetical protein